MSLTLLDIRKRIWTAAKGKTDVIEQAKQNINFTDDYNALLKEVRRLKKKPRAITDDSWKVRYRAAHKAWQLKEYPNAIKDQDRMMRGEYGKAYAETGIAKPVEGYKEECDYKQTEYPDIHTANGLMSMVCNYLMWMHHRATRINVIGRVVEKQDKVAYGMTITTKKHIPSSTKKGSADISSTIKINGTGTSVMWEVKVGRDKPSDAQLKEQQRELKAGGHYYFIHTPVEFFTIYDSLFTQGSLFK